MYKDAEQKYFMVIIMSWMKILLGIMIIDEFIFLGIIFFLG